MLAQTAIIASFNFEGNSNDNFGSIVGTDTSMTYSTGNGKILQGAGFNGSTSFIDYGNVLTQSTNLFSISILIKTSATVRQGIVNKCDSTGRGYIFDILATGEIRFGLIDNNLSIYNYVIRDSSAIVNDNVWHHILAVRSSISGTPDIYIDGILANGTALNAGTVNDISTTDPLLVGSSAITGIISKFTGSMDILEFFNDDVSADINFLYNGGNGRQFPFGNGNMFLVF